VRTVLSAKKIDREVAANWSDVSCAVCCNSSVWSAMRSVLMPAQLG